ncbi:MAG: FAD-dependent oxidoreductase [Sedimentibacter sp.]
MSFKNVFSQYNIGNLTIDNRLVMPGMDSGHSAHDGSINQDTIDYYTARAKGGFGLIVVEYSSVDPSGVGMPGELDISSDDRIPGYITLVESIKKSGARVALQLHHAGRETVSALTGMQPVAPSPIPCPLNRETPRAMSTEEVYEMVEKYINAALRAKKAGFDAVELHAAHGYLIASFMSPRSNKRLDEFGGNLGNRMRFIKLIIEGIKNKCGKDFPILVRISSDEKRIGGITINEAVVQAKLIEEYGADAIHVSIGSYGAFEYIVPTNDLPDAFNLSSAAAVKKAVKIPVISVGRYVEPEVIENAIASGETDFVSLGRQSIADPDFPNKMKANMLMDIVPCQSCNQRCNANDPIVAEIGEHGIACMLNPLSSGRSSLEIKKTDNPKKVMIVGAGPAGLETAWVSAKRGHDVTVYEKDTQCGGQYYIASYPPFKQRLTIAIQHYMHMCNKYGVKFVMGQEATEEKIKNEKPDVLVIATGATPIIPNIEGIDGKNIKKANDVLMGKETVIGKVLVVGGGLVGVETAEYCTDYCDHITIVEMMNDLVPTLNLMSRTALFRRFKQDGVEMHANTKVLKFVDDGAIVEENGVQKEMRGYDCVILAMGSKNYNPFVNAENHAKEVYTIGDAVKARTAVQAIFEGAMTALKI